MGCNCGKKFTAPPVPVPDHILQEAVRRMKESSSTSTTGSTATTGSGQNLGSNEGQ